MAKNKIYEIEIMRALGCLLVVLIHVTAFFWTTFTPGSLAFKSVVLMNTLARFVVPCFIFMSGFVLYYAYSDKEINPLTFYKKRMSKVLIPYLIWCVIYIFWNIRFQGYAYDVKSVLRYIILGKANSHLYFVCLIIQFYVLFPLIIKVFKWFKNRYLATLFFFGFNFYFIFNVKLFYSSRLFMYYIMFFVLGLFIADLKKKPLTSTKWLKVISVMSVLCYLVITVYYVVNSYKNKITMPLILPKFFNISWWLYSILSIIVLYVFFQFVVQKQASILKWKSIDLLSRHSFAIYLSHSFFMKILHKLPPYIHLNANHPKTAFVFEYILIVVVALTFSILLEKLMSRIRDIKSQKNEKQ